eukprot:90222-Chlamydomonas_euryale.AAC.1
MQRTCKQPAGQREASVKRVSSQTSTQANQAGGCLPKGVAIRTTGGCADHHVLVNSESNSVYMSGEGRGERTEGTMCMATRRWCQTD